MADKINLTIVAPDKTLFKGVVEEVYATGVLGEFGVLEGHAPFFCETEPGELHFKAGGAEKFAAVAEGFAVVSNDAVTMLVEAAEFPEEIDVAMAEKYRQRAEKGIDGLDLYNPEYRFRELRLKRALNRLSVAKRAGQAK